MKISEARQLYAAQLNTLRTKKQELTKMLKEMPASGPNVDRAEISHELKLVSENYEQIRAGMEQIQNRETLIQNMEASKQQSEAMTEAASDMLKCLEIARRIADGDRVPPADEKKLMEFNFEMYLAAKNMAMLRQKSDPKEYDSLWEDENTAKEEEPSPSEIAENTEISIAPPTITN